MAAELALAVAESVWVAAESVAELAVAALAVVEMAVAEMAVAEMGAFDSPLRRLFLGRSR